MRQLVKDTTPGVEEGVAGVVYHEGTRHVAGALRLTKWGVWECDTPSSPKVMIFTSASQCGNYIREHG